MQLIDEKRAGLFAEHAGVAAPVYEVRATIPAVEAIRKAGNVVEPLHIGYRITLCGLVPRGIVAVALVGDSHVGLRMSGEPEYPQEIPDFWAEVAWTPCPVCGAPVVWYEAGYVPGYRVCARPPHHHSLAR